MATAPDNHTKCFVSDDKLLNYQHVWLKFLQHFLFLLFYIPFKICKPSFNSIDIMAYYVLITPPKNKLKFTCTKERNGHVIDPLL